MRPRRVSRRKKESPISVVPPPAPDAVSESTTPGGSTAGSTFAEQIALSAAALQSLSSPTFEEQINKCRRQLKPTPPPSPPESPPEADWRALRHLATTRVTVDEDAAFEPPTWCFGGLYEDGSDEEWTPTCTDVVSVSCF